MKRKFKPGDIVISNGEMFVLGRFGWKHNGVLQMVIAYPLGGGGPTYLGAFRIFKTNKSIHEPALPMFTKWFKNAIQHAT